jgi:hypothetical protein
MAVAAAAAPAGSGASRSPSTTSLRPPAAPPTRCATGSPGLPTPSTTSMPAKNLRYIAPQPSSIQRRLNASARARGDGRPLNRRKQPPPCPTTNACHHRRCPRHRRGKSRCSNTEPKPNQPVKPHTDRRAAIATAEPSPLSRCSYGCQPPWSVRDGWIDRRPNAPLTSRAVALFHSRVAERESPHAAIVAGHAPTPL